LALSNEKNKKASSSKEQILRSLSKALKVDNSSNDKFEEDFDEDELAFIS